MHFSAHQLPYQQTGVFSKIIIDYLEDAPNLQQFYSFRPTLEGIRQAIQLKKSQVIDRSLLVKILQGQYGGVVPSEKVNGNIEALLSENTFTICTAHQPNLFTGPLYFIYKILHAIKLADYLQQQFPEYHFVPVYYIGSEDADLAELNHFNVDGKKYEWQTTQTGAVGRMKVDDLLIRIIHELEGQLSVYPHGSEIMEIVRKVFRKGETIQQATFELVHHLFADFGLVVLIPDHPDLKRCMLPVFQDDLLNQKPSAIVSATSENLSQQYNAQANPRDINLFYLKDHIRERIIRNGNNFQVHNTEITFTLEEIQIELLEHPERFSPNVILRGLFQETILPNIIFIGGGGELAYWLQLKALFDHYQTPFPVLILRNSFLLIEDKLKRKIEKLALSLEDIFQHEEYLLNKLVLRASTLNLSLNGSLSKAEEVYEEIKRQAEAIDATLAPHVAAIKTRSLKLLKELEKKMLRAEKKKFESEERQITAIRSHLFPKNGLQERHDNITYWYAVYGKELIQELYTFSLTLEQQFTVMSYQSNGE
ncbi:bacillithiol biosynthesis cysteine-adding enzyme BshC [Chitinophagaceae bacterium LB-8]|uniref:Putative cysteine ligase BshC n=1 Tax=Paraflavisolibacter caeni TaxID=2982496 RepID=A0A9X3B873_9BACT|nr:bacillithiol biosynthesis cysteine-adding enzyme BshC [Paraflavisolibacter caeni]MCU7550265.1 bacillithiol biosynthesis cysteine-adding enzyme BshC [Paraflavisolibacter caeni]